MPDDRKRTMFLGLAFLILLVVSSVENMVFFSILSEIFSNQFLTVDMFFIQVGMLFIHNVLVISRILSYKRVTECSCHPC